jgi:predicted nucleotidyltransferase
MLPEHPLVNVLQAVLERHPEIRCCYLYGSAARGERGPASDVDLAVACDAPLAGTEKTALAEECATALGRDVDLLDLVGASGLILRSALRGVCMLCRDVACKYGLMRALVYDQEDLQPLRRQMMRLRREAFAHGR